jgi:alkaline phosphatase D
VIPDQKDMDEWGNFPHERQRLLTLAKKAGDAILLSGNVHFAEVSQDEVTGLTEFTSSGMTHINQLYGDAPNPYRVEEPFIDLNFGLIEIDWKNGEVGLSACGVDGKVAFRQQLVLGNPKG